MGILYLFGSMLIRFNRFELDEDRFELRSEGRTLAVQPQVLETIRYLARNAAYLVTREELLAKVWKGADVSDAALSQAIKEARKAIGDSASRPSIIETVRGKGFRFKAPVTRIDTPPPPATEAAGAIASAEDRLPAPALERRTVRNAPPHTEDSVEPSARVGKGPAGFPSAGRGGARRPSETRRAGADSAATPSRGVFVGRSAELQRLVERTSRPPSAPGELLLVTGAPGVGKTRLLEELARFAAAHVEIIRGRCWEALDAPPLWPFREALRAYAEKRTPEQMRALIRDDGSELHTLSELRPFVTCPVEPLGETPQDRFRVLDALSRVLHRAANAAPLLLMLDDVHAADEASLLLLDLLCRTLSESPLVLVAGCREPEANARGVLSSLLGGAATNVQVLRLDCLAPPEVGEWIAAATGCTPSPRAVAVCYEATSGHPFLVENLLRSLPSGWQGETLDEVAVHGRLPDRIAGGIRSRLARLPEGTVRLLGAASVLGRTVSLSVLAELVGAPPEELVVRLEPALQEGLIEWAAAGGDVLFAHIIVRETIYRDLPTSARLAWHSAAARALEPSVVDRPERRLQVARHSLEAMPLVEARVASEQAELAADEAQRQLAFELAATYYERALEALNGAAPDPLARARVLLKLAEAQCDAANVPQAVTTYRKVLALSRAHGMNDVFERGLLGWFATIREQASVEPSFHAALEEAMGRVVHDASRARLLAVKALSSMFVVEVGRRQRWILEALDVARDVGDPELRFTVLRAVKWTYLHAIDVRHSLELAHELDEVSTALARPQALVDVVDWRGSCLLELGRGDAFVAETQRCERAAERYRYPNLGWQARRMQAACAFLRGALDESTEQAHAASVLGERAAGPAMARALLGAHLSLLALEKTGSEAVALFREVRAIAEAFLALVPKFVPWQLSRARAHLELGDREAARAELRTIIDAGLDRLPHDRNRAPLIAKLASLAADLGEQETVLKLLPELLQHAAQGRHLVVGGATTYAGPASYYAGLLTLFVDDPSAARAWFEQSLRESERIGSETFKAWSWYGLAQALARTEPGSSRSGDAALRAAHRAAQTLGLTRLQAKLDQS